jgi:hypothetical protein
MMVFAQIIIGKSLSILNHEKALRNEMAAAGAFTVFFMELFLWDTILMPLLLSGVAMNKKVRSCFPALKTDLTQQ